MNEYSYRNWMTVVYDNDLHVIDIINPQKNLMIVSNDKLYLNNSNTSLEEIVDEANKAAASIIVRNVEKASKTDHLVYFEYINKHEDNTNTYVICIAEKGLDGLLYVNVRQLEEDNIVEARRDGGFSNYLIDTTLNTLSVGVYLRHYDDNGTSRYVLFNDVVKKFFESDNVFKSKYWSQVDDDHSDRMFYSAKPEMQFEKSLNDDEGRVVRWLSFTKKYLHSKASGYYIVTTINDITERKLEEGKLEKQYAILDSMYKHLPVGVALFGKDGGLLSCNAKYLQIFGLKEGGDTIKSINYFDRSIFPESHTQEMNDETVVEFSLEYDFDKAAGNHLDTTREGTASLLIKGTRILTSEGDTESYLEIVEDITEKVTKQHELELTNSNLKLAMSAGRVSAWQYDVNTGTFSTILGSTLCDSRILLEKMEGVFHPDDFKSLKELIYSIASGKEERGSIVVRCFNSDKGGYTYYESEMEGRLNENGEVISVVGTQHDITERIMAKMQLNTVRQSLDMVADASNVLILGHDLLTNERKVLYGHRLLEKRPSLKRRSLSIHPEDQAMYDSTRQQIINREKESSSQEVRIAEDDGTFYFYESSVMGITDQSGKVVSIICALYDISEQRQKRLELERIQQYLQVAIDSGGGVIWLYDVENQTFSIVQGKSSIREYCTYKEFFDNMAPEYVELMQGKINRVISGSTKKADGYYQVKNQGRKVGWVHLHIKGIQEDGVVKLVIMFSQNVTELIEQRDAIKRSANDLNLALVAGNVSAWTFDVSAMRFRTLYGETIFGEGMSVEDVSKLMHPEDVDKLNHILKSLLEQKETKAETIFRYRDVVVSGGYRYYENRLVSFIENEQVASITGTQKDITERHLKKVELEEFKIKTNLINRSCNITQWDYDPYNHIVYSTFFDDTPDKGFEIETYLLFVHPDDVDRIKEVLFFVNKRAVDSVNFEIRLKKQNSTEYRRVVIDGIALKDDKGRIGRYIGIRRDIHEMTQLNEQLTENNMINTLILDNIDVGLVYMTPDCMINWSNMDSFKHIVKTMEFKTFKGGSPCSFLTKDGCEKPEWCVMKQSIQSQKNKTNIIHYKKMDLEVTSIPVISSSGLVKGSLLKFCDVTEKTKVDNEIKDAKERAEKSEESALLAKKLLEEIVERVPGAIFIKDASDHYKYVDANKLFCNTIGIDKFDIIGKTDFEIFDLVIANKFYRHDIAIIDEKRTTESYDIDLTIHGKDVSWQVSESSILTAEGRWLIVGVATDVSNLREINRALKESQLHAEQADRLKSAFLANMSHEIRTPLNAIVGFSDLLMETDDPLEKEEFCKVITTNNELLLHLIGDILDLSKIEAGMIAYKREVFDLSSFFDELTFSLKQRVTNPDIEYIVENPYKSVIVECDKYRYAQVVTNFVTNAIKYTPSGYIKIGYRIENGGIRTYVIDSGIGVPEEKRTKVFQRFEKLDTFAQGNGLGLSIVKAVTEANGGQVGFESEEGKGSTFWSWWPFPSIKMEPVIPDATPVPDIVEDNVVKTCNAETILVAEDDNSNFFLVKSILKKQTLVRALNGIEAVKFASEGKFDVILMDFKMPVLGGLDATRKIREFDNKTPIIALTAYAFASDKEDALAAGCNAYLAKPIKKVELISIINKVIEDKK